jgi:hydroxyacylglutathione hydrolase
VGTIGCLLFAVACAARPVPMPQSPPGLAVTTGPGQSMIYMARVEGGVIAIDLGWIGAEAEMRRGLAAIEARPEDVRAVFLTHSHVDHVGAWHLVQGSTFHMGAAEVPRFLGRARHRGWLPRMAAILPEDLPHEGEVRIEPFQGDTVFAFGPDTLRAFLVPGHTAGSAAYLFRGVLFVGDAMSPALFGGFRSARWIHADDAGLAARSLAALWPRVERHGVRWVCTAHARCSRFTPALLAGASGERLVTDRRGSGERARAGS